MIYNGVHKLKSQKWNEVSITDQVTLQADSPSIFLEISGRGSWKETLVTGYDQVGKIVNGQWGGGEGLRS